MLFPSFRDPCSCMQMIVIKYAHLCCQNQLMMVKVVKIYVIACNYAGITSWYKNISYCALIVKYDTMGGTC